MIIRNFKFIFTYWPITISSWRGILRFEQSPSMIIKICGIILPKIVHVIDQIFRRRKLFSVNERIRRSHSCYIKIMWPVNDSNEVIKIRNWEINWACWKWWPLSWHESCSESVSPEFFGNIVGAMKCVFESQVESHLCHHIRFMGNIVEATQISKLSFSYLIMD